MPKGVDALRLLDAREHFDLITSDICNDGMWGTDFIDEMKRRYPHIPTLLITGCTDIADAVHKGMDFEP